MQNGDMRGVVERKSCWPGTIRGYGKRGESVVVDSSCSYGLFAIFGFGRCKVNAELFLQLSSFQ